jgi:hypothetical protein
MGGDPQTLQEFLDMERAALVRFTPLGAGGSGGVPSGVVRPRPVAAAAPQVGPPPLFSLDDTHQAVGAVVWFWDESAPGGRKWWPARVDGVDETAREYRLARLGSKLVHLPQPTAFVSFDAHVHPYDVPPNSVEKMWARIQDALPYKSAKRLQEMRDGCDALLVESKQPRRRPAADAPAPKRVRTGELGPVPEAGPVAAPEPPPSPPRMEPAEVASPAQVVAAAPASPAPAPALDCAPPAMPSATTPEPSGRLRATLDTFNSVVDVADTLAESLRALDTRRVLPLPAYPARGTRLTTEALSEQLWGADAWAAPDDASERDARLLEAADARLRRLKTILARFSTMLAAAVDALAA